MKLMSETGPVPFLTFLESGTIFWHNETSITPCGNFPGTSLLDCLMVDDPPAPRHQYRHDGAIYTYLAGTSEEENLNSRSPKIAIGVHDIGRRA